MKLGCFRLQKFCRGLFAPCSVQETGWFKSKLQLFPITSLTVPSHWPLQVLVAEATGSVSVPPAKGTVLHIARDSAVCKLGLQPIRARYRWPLH